jgi:O-antigen ligase
LILSTLLAIDFASRIPIERQLQLLERIFVTIILMSVVSQIFFPAFFPVTNFGNYVMDPDAWHGVFIHKNDFGRFIAVTMLIALVRSSYSRQGRVLRLVWILATFVLIVKAHSSTGLATMLLMCLCARWIFTLHWTIRVRKFAVLAFIFIAGADLSEAGRICSDRIARTRRHSHRPHNLMGAIARERTEASNPGVWLRCILDSYN